MNLKEDSENHWQTLGELASYLWPKGRVDLRTRVFFALLALLCSKLVNVYVPFLYKQAVDALTIIDLKLALPLGVILAYGGARLGNQLFGELRDFIFERVAQFAQRNVALRTFEHLHGLSLAFHLDRQTGGLSRVIERGVRGIRFVLSFMTFNILPTVLEILLVTGILIYTFDISFGLIVFFTIAIYIGFTLVVTEWRLQYRKTMNKNDTEANTRAIDSLLNYETVKYFSNEQHEYDRYHKSLKRYEDAAVASQKSLSFLNIGQGAIIAVGLIWVMLLAGQGVVDKEMTVGDFVMINTYLIQLYLPLNFLGFVYREVKNSLVDMDKMFELKSVHADVGDLPEAPTLQVDEGRVEFNKVSFRYRSDRPIIKNLSFNIPSGKTLALVGHSGSGKSTVSRLMFRFYDINQGSIMVDSQDIRHVSQKSLRQSIGMVPQDTVLFNDTIYYNIKYGNITATDREIKQAARMAQIHSFIMKLPDKYDTKVGERGLKLSGGEKQRVAIARMLLKNPSILIFDEATSALDSETEKEIQKSLEAVSKNRTTLMIAHRLSTIIHADEIIVLKNGRAVERGTHRQLLKKHRGEYARMWRQQQEEKN